jgi:hypothetical protein
MRIDPQLQALRGNASPQRDAQGVLFDAREAWSVDPCVAPVLGELEAYGKGAPLAECPALAAALGDPAAAMTLVGALVERMLPALRREPLGQVPLRQFSGNGVSALLLARGTRAMLMLSAREPGDVPREAVAFSDGERHELVLAGEAEARLVRLGRARPEVAQLAVADVPLQARVSLALDQSREALLPGRVTRRLVSLRLTRAAERPQPTREYRLSDGAFLHQSSGDIGESRHELMLALLGRMGRTDAAPLMGEMACEGSEHIRWQALRECLALDTSTGFRTLCTIARDAADPLASPAGALRAQLLEAHPVLAQLEQA